MPEHTCSKCGHVDSDSDSDSDSRDSDKPEASSKRTRLPRKVLRDKKEFDNTYHPGLDVTKLAHTVHRLQVSERKPPDLEAYDKVISNPKQLCRNCGWHTVYETHCHGYTSRLKVAYLRLNYAIWDLGPNGPWMLRDEPNIPNSPWQKDYVTQQLLRKEKPSIPLVEMHRFSGPDDKFNFTIMSRAKGRMLQEMWGKMTIEQRDDVKQDLRRHMMEWRQITRPYMQRMDGSELRDCLIGDCTGFGCIKTGRNEEEWLENLTPGMRKGLLLKMWMKNKGWLLDESERASWVKEVDEKVDQLKANFPRGGPYVLSHGDLHYHNIFISDENEEKKFKITAIIDWETAGFFPWWAETDHYERGGLFELSSDERYSSKNRQKIMETAVGPVIEAWYEGGNHTMSMHMPNSTNRYYPPSFCDCQPYAQEYRDTHFGVEEEHVDVFDVDSTDSEDDEIDNFKKFPHNMRKFMRWFKEISDRDSKDTGSTQ